MFDCQQSPIFFINSWRFCLTQISSKKTLIFSIKSWFVLFSRWFFTLICFNYRPFQCLWWWFETVSVSTNRPCFYSHHFFWFQDFLDCNKSSGPPGGGAAASWIGGFQTFFALSLVCAFKVTTWWVHQEKQRFFFCSVYLFQSVRSPDLSGISEGCGGVEDVDQAQECPEGHNGCPWTYRKSFIPIPSVHSFIKCSFEIFTISKW